MMLLMGLMGGCMPPWDEVRPGGETGTPDTHDSVPVDDTSDTDDSGDTPPLLVERVSGLISASTTWTRDTTWVLEDIVYVTGGTLAIESGTTILAEEGAALIVTPEGRLNANGVQDAPIVFTSAAAAGSRKRGDWGGVALLGYAPLNTDSGVASLEGLPDEDASFGVFGGSDATHNCGVLKYTRVEFAGAVVGRDKELNALTLAGCGSGSFIENVQAHMGLDDGIEIFGGTVDIKNAVITRAGDDALDWDQGWQGRIQFLIVQQEQTVDSGDFQVDKGIEANGFAEEPYAVKGKEPSLPTIHNATFIGSGVKGSDEVGINLRGGTGGILGNIILMDFPRGAIDIQHTETVDRVEDGALTLSHVVVHNSVGGITAFPAEASDNDDGFIEGTELPQRFPTIHTDIDPLLASPRSLTAPSFVPDSAALTSLQGALPPSGEFWDGSANYIGAVRPGTATIWYSGWTSFPEN